MSDAKTEAMTKLDAILAGQARIEAALAAMKTAPRAATPGGGGVCFPNYGRSKGLPVAGASKGDLDFYRTGCERTLADPDKARWHDRERVLLAAILKELGEEPATPPADDGPPPADDVPF
jgi:hypothetical protein